MNGAKIYRIARLGLFLVISLLFTGISCYSTHGKDRGEDIGQGGQQAVGGSNHPGDDENGLGGGAAAGDSGGQAGSGYSGGGQAGGGQAGGGFSGGGQAGGGQAGGGQAGGIAPAVDAGASLEACGSVLCRSDMYCCNESCSICAPIGGSCTQQQCKPDAGPCDASECGAVSLERVIDLCGNVSSTQGPVCERDTTGRCVWVVDGCPDFSADACGGCAPDEYCEVQNCGNYGEQGSCAPRPTDCAKFSSMIPVCGCDRMDYDHPCFANAAGFSVAWPGQCALNCSYGFADCDQDPATGCETNLNTPENCGWCGNTCPYTFCVEGSCAEATVCGGIEGSNCPAGQYCDFATGNGCDVIDGMGVCRTQPLVCTTRSNPVCGCDNKTYDNACSATEAGVSIRYDAECKTDVCTPGMDQTCNDNPILSSLRGSCNQDGTCTCYQEHNPLTGKCL